MLKHITIKNFRNIDNLSQEINPKGNLVIAKNSSGKTNLLESIYFSIYSDSLRETYSNNELISDKNDVLYVKTLWDEGILEVSLKKDGKGLIKFNDKSTIKRKILEKLSCIIFAPNSVNIVSGEPESRRKDLNNYISSLDQNYYKELMRYTKFLKNRNSFLKMIRDNKALKRDLEYWTNNIIESGFNIFKKRYEVFKDLSYEFKEISKEMGSFVSSDSLWDLKYLANTSNSLERYKDDLKAKFDLNIDKEIIVGKTLYGVQKDDYTVELDNKPMRFYGSRGQQRIAVLLLKFAEFNLFKKTLNRSPIFLIDDLMSELDTINREHISNYLIDKDIQFILTTAEEFEIPKKLFTTSTVITI